jgi:type IX secretion system PorP/SprF family membrane protein
MRYLIIILAVFLSSIKSIAQNQFHIGQYAIHQPFLNPASIGSMETINLAMLYKKQWVKFEGAPHLQGFNFNMPLTKAKKSFVGLNILNDKAGLNNSTEVSGTFAYKFKTSKKSRLIFGLTASLNLIKSDLSDASIIDVNDPLYTSNTPTFAVPNFKFGAYYYFKKFYLGFVAPNILENKVIQTDGVQGGSYGFNPKNMHYYIHSGYKFDLKNKNSIITSVLVKEVSGSPLQVDFNVHTMFKQRFGLGITARTSKDVMGTVSMYIIPELLLSYGYEHAFSALNQFNSGTHEILLIYKLNGGHQTIAFPRL